MFYYFLVNDKIFYASKSKKDLEERSKTKGPCYGLEIHSTKKEIINKDGLFIFKEDENNYELNTFKEFHINYCKNATQNYIYLEYPIYRQCNITNGIEEGLEEMKSYISNCRNKYNIVKDYINAKTEPDDLPYSILLERFFNSEKTFEEIIEEWKKSIEK